MEMKKIIVAVGVAAVGILLFTNTAKAAEIKEGQWSMTTVIHIDGMDEAMEEMKGMSPQEKAMMEKMMGGMKFGAAGGGGGMSTTITQCITNDNPVPESDKQKNCQQTHSKKGNTVNFEVICADSHTSGQVTYQNNSMKGRIKSTQTKNGKKENVTMDISGKYVGPCK